MQLYTSPTTPFGRKISVQIRESGLTDRVTEVTVSGSPLDVGNLPVQINPLGKIPCLSTDHGALYDSRVIGRYLDDLSGAGFYPTGAELWPALVLEATADGILDAAVAMVYEIRMRPENFQFPAWIEGQWAKIARALDAIEPKAGDMGALNNAQIALGVALAYLDFRHDPRHWREGRPNMAAWYAEFSQRPSMRATEPPKA